jgi:hypothetical protein
MFDLRRFPPMKYLAMTVVVICGTANTAVMIVSVSVLLLGSRNRAITIDTQNISPCKLKCTTLATWPMAQISTLQLHVSQQGTSSRSHGASRCKCCFSCLCQQQIHGCQPMNRSLVSCTRLCHILDFTHFPYPVPGTCNAHTNASYSGTHDTVVTKEQGLYVVANLLRLSHAHPAVATARACMVMENCIMGSASTL